MQIIYQRNGLPASGKDSDKPEDEVLESYDELIILKVEEDEDGETFLSAIEDQYEFDEIGQIFEERLSEYYEIAEDDE